MYYISFPCLKTDKMQRTSLHEVDKEGVFELEEAYSVHVVDGRFTEYVESFHSKEGAKNSKQHYFKIWH